jgi:1-acyl-sn-glycerol-3-phosphate acyltransferase
MDSKPNEKALPWLSKLIVEFGRKYNDYECIGMEHVPKEGPALIVFYHGFMPLDAWYFGLEYYRLTGRLIRGLGDRWLFKTPGVAWLVKAVGAIEGNRKDAIKMLNDGHLVGVAPGGVREAISGTEKNYELLWKKRVGFAQVAIDANVPIVVGFTENVEELYRLPFAETKFFQNLYEKTRLPLVPVVGLGILPFPVKLRTRLAPPVYPKPNETAEELALRVRDELRKLMGRYLTKKPSILRAIKERFEP